MRYFEEIAERVSKIDFEKFPYGLNIALPFMHGLSDVIVDNVDSSLIEDMYLYFERAQNGHSIIAFRIPSVTSSLVFDYHTKIIKGQKKKKIRVLLIKGEEAFNLLSLISKKIIPFFEEVDEYYEHKECYAVTNTVHVKTGFAKLCIYNSSIEQTYSIESLRQSTTISNDNKRKNK